MTVLDRWDLTQTNNLIEDITSAYDNYEFYKVYHKLNIFFTSTLSATYLDILKDRLYTWKANGLPRRSSQTALYLIAKNLMSLMAPILSFLSEETYSYLPGIKKESVLLENFPQHKTEWQDANLESDFTKILEVRSLISKELELLRQNKVIGANLEAKVTIKSEGEIYSALKAYEKELKELFIVSQVRLEQGPLSIVAERADGVKCSRCWIYDEKTGTDSRFPDVCPKCVEALS
jgi:isoleucyl-tRNA synthetase